jgi:ankyrin repeat protein
MIGKQLRIAGAVALAVPALALSMPAPAFAQFSDSYKFLDAVRKKEAETVTQYVEAPGTTLINTRDRNSGETALLITTARKDLTWMAYLLGHGARTDIAANNGRFPLMLAVETRFPEGVDLLLARGANVNQTNSGGETALIRAVQLKDMAMVRMLVAKGADPDKRDNLAGMSARDYATRDARDTGILEALATAKPAEPAKPVQGPVF